MSKKTREYCIGFTEACVGPEGWIVESVYRVSHCTAKSKAEALMSLINLEAVYEVRYVERVKDD